ncbi:uncharacterized protein LOC129888767 isoform X2 [Solanum dulcamara]|uniref:uncharacterized protein LOC129888767 isoform X2 n=1 Tax=Solanum dulcamara TaxID=45834 RepID=UPI0024861C6C|nr:uncharacterized protein LOC129888767 isoform X2 [Solanum dulcamara]
MSRVFRSLSHPSPNKPIQDNGQKALISDDILAKRLKNRERQRRYRERKRLKADTMKVLGTNKLVSLPVEVPVSVAPPDRTVPVNFAPLDSSVPVKVGPLDSSMPVNVAPLDSSVPVNVAPRAYVMPVDVASGESVMPVRCSSRESVTRVYSGRNWKRDARNAHAVRQNKASFNSTVSPNLASTCGSQATLLPHVEQSDVALSNVISSPVSASENNGTPKSFPSRRNWKAEARNKKS